MNNRIIGLDKANAKLRATGLILGRELPSLVAQQARLTAISFARSSQPFGTGADALAKGRGAVLGDIRKVYVSTGKAYSDIAGKRWQILFWKAIKAGEFQEAQLILKQHGRSLRGVDIGPFSAALHRSSRNARTGRVSLKSPLLIVTDPRRLDAYIRERQGNVGTGKSGWANVARGLGGIRGLRSKRADGTSDITANWITRQDGRGRHRENFSDPLNPSIIITSSVSYAEAILDKTERAQAVIIARNRLIKSLEIAIHAETRALRRAA